MRRPVRIVTLIAASAMLAGCGLFGDDDRDAPPPGLFPQSDFGDGSYADPEPEPAFGTPPPRFDDGGFGDASFNDGDFARFDESSNFDAPPPFDARLADQPGPLEPTFGQSEPPLSLPSNAPPALAALDPPPNAVYLGFVPVRNDAELYFDWLWEQHAVHLDGAQPYVTPAPDPISGEPAVHLYTLDLSAMQARDLCAALTKSLTPCRPLAR